MLLFEYLSNVNQTGETLVEAKLSCIFYKNNLLSNKEQNVKSPQLMGASSGDLLPKDKLDFVLAYQRHMYSSYDVNCDVNANRSSTAPTPELESVELGIINRTRLATYADQSTVLVCSLTVSKHYASFFRSIY